MIAERIWSLKNEADEEEGGGVWLREWVRMRICFFAVWVGGGFVGEGTTSRFIDFLPFAFIFFWVFAFCFNKFVGFVVGRRSSSLGAQSFPGMRVSLAGVNPQTEEATGMCVFAS